MADHWTHSADIGVGCFRINALVFNDVLEGIRHEAAVAPLVAIFHGAVHQILRTEGHQDTCGLLELPFQSSDCTEGPARTTGTLGMGKVVNE